MQPKFIVNASFLEKPETENNGVLRYCREISMHMKEIDPNIQFICSKNIPDSKYANFLQPIKFGNSRGQMWEQIALPYYIYRYYNKMSLLTLNNISPVFYNKNISSILDLTWKHFPDTFGRKARFYMSLLIPLIIRRANKIITISEYSKNDILSHYPINPNNIQVIYPGFYFNKNILDYESCNQILREKNILPKQYFLATMYKNPEKLIQAYESLNLEKKYKLVFFGKFFDKVFGHLRIKFDENPNIIYLGMVSDSLLSYLYSNAFAFVYPSLNEGFGMPPLEAMEQHCPVIASKVASIPEVCGNAVLYVDPLDIKSISSAMQTLIEDAQLREQLVELGINRVKMFNYKYSANALIEYFKSIYLYN